MKFLTLLICLGFSTGTFDNKHRSFSSDAGVGTAVSPGIPHSQILQPAFGETHQDLAIKFDQIINEYFHFNFGKIGDDYVSLIAEYLFPTHDVRNQISKLKTLDEQLRSRIIYGAKKIVEKYAGGKKFYKIGSRDRNEISYRVHRFMGALEFIGMRADCISENSIQLLSRVLDGANANLWFTSTSDIRKIIAGVKDSRNRFWVLQLIGKCAWSGSAIPKFMNHLMNFVSRAGNNDNPEATLIYTICADINLAVNFDDISDIERRVFNILQTTQ